MLIDAREIKKNEKGTDYINKILVFFGKKIVFRSFGTFKLG